jgi:transcriptional regulator of acetoin/glycerol metabolism
VAAPAFNPWVAMDVTTDPVARARLLRRAHERALGGDATASIDVRELVLGSWRRSLAAGVTPDQGGAPLGMTSSELERAQEHSPLAPAVGVIHSKLSSLDEDARHIVAIADSEGRLIWVTGDRDTCDRAREMRFQ